MILGHGEDELFLSFSVFGITGPEMLFCPSTYLPRK